MKATGEIVDVDFDKDALANDYPPYRTNEIPSRFFLAEQLKWIDIEEKAEPDYWDKLLHQYAGMAMQGILSGDAIVVRLAQECTTELFPIVVGEMAHSIATALVKKMKEKEERE